MHKTDSTSDEVFDVVAVGGGPGGSTLAALVAMQGHKVLLLEKEAFPIYKIGESLLPSTVHGICSLLGVSEELKSANFIVKQGGTFRWGKNPEPWTFTFSQSSKFRGPTSYAYQVERMKFDAILLNNARRKGVDVREKHTVVDLLADDGRIVGLTFLDDRGKQRTVRSHYVIDASGHTSPIVRYAGDRIYSRFFRNVAVFGYYHNGGRLPEPCTGNILCTAFDRGWFWYIPLSETLTSVGAVIGQEHVDILKHGAATGLKELIEGCQPIRELLANAERVTEGPYGEVRVRRDYSYSHSAFWRPGLALVGDAACFIDPVFSSGVHLATYSALLAARSLNSYLSGDLPESRVFTEFEKRYRREYGYFYDFLVAFYDLDQSVDTYYWNARKVINSEEGANEAFIQLVGGIGGSGEELYQTADEFLKARAGLGARLFPGAGNKASQTPKEGRLGKAQFMKNMLTEIVQIQHQAIIKNNPLPLRPLFEGGLVPSIDGCHWAEPAE